MHFPVNFQCHNAWYYYVTVSTDCLITNVHCFFHLIILFIAICSNSDTCTCMFYPSAANTPIFHDALSSWSYLGTCLNNVQNVSCLKMFKETILNHLKTLQTKNIYGINLCFINWIIYKYDKFKDYQHDQCSLSWLSRKFSYWFNRSLLLTFVFATLDLNRKLSKWLFFLIWMIYTAETCTCSN